MYVRSLAVLALLAVGFATASTVEDDNLFYGWSNGKDDVVDDIIAARLSAGVAGIPTPYVPTPEMGPLVGAPRLVMAPHHHVIVKGTVAQPTQSKPADGKGKPAGGKGKPADGKDKPAQGKPDDKNVPTVSKEAANATPANITAHIQQVKADSAKAIKDAEEKKKEAIEKIHADQVAQITKAAAANNAREAAERKEVADNIAARKAQEVEEAKAKDVVTEKTKALETLEAELDAARTHAKKLSDELAKANADIQRTYDLADQSRNTALAALKAHEEAETKARLAARAAREAARVEARRVNDLAAVKAHDDAIKAINEATEKKKTVIDSKYGSFTNTSAHELQDLRGKIKSLRHTILQKKAEQAAAAKVALEKKLSDAKASMARFKDELDELNGRQSGDHHAPTDAKPSDGKKFKSANSTKNAAKNQSSPKNGTTTVIPGGKVRIVPTVVGAFPGAVQMVPRVVKGRKQVIAVSAPGPYRVSYPASYVPYGVPAMPYVAGGVQSEAQLAALATAVDPKEGLKVAQEARNKAAKRAAKLQAAAAQLRSAHEEAKNVALQQYKAQLRARRAQNKAAKAQRKFLKARSEEASVHSAVRATTRGLVNEKLARVAMKDAAIRSQIPGVYADAARAQSFVNAQRMAAARAYAARYGAPIVMA